MTYFTCSSQSPQRPYSDAYISGMSSKRRKLLQTKKPTTSVQQLIADGVRQTVASTRKSATSSTSSTRNAQPADELIAAISNDSAVLSAYRDEVKASVSQRLKGDSDFDDDKHPSSSKAFK